MAGASRDDCVIAHELNCNVNLSQSKRSRKHNESAARAIKTAFSILRRNETHELEQPPFFLGGAPAAFWAVDRCLAIQFARAGVFGLWGEVFEILRKDFCADALGKQSDDAYCAGEFSDLDGENLADSDFMCGFEVLAGEFDVTGIACGCGL